MKVPYEQGVATKFVRQRVVKTFGRGEKRWEIGVGEGWRRGFLSARDVLRRRRSRFFDAGARSGASEGAAVESGRRFQTAPRFQVARRW